MRIHQQQPRESERPSSADLLNKILRRGSHATDPSEDSSRRQTDAAHRPVVAEQSGRKGSHHQSNNQQRPSVSSGNHRFSAFFIDPLYHAIMMNKGKEDGASLAGAGTCHVEQLSEEEATRRQGLTSMRFEDLHLAFDPFDGAEPEDVMDNNELESLLEQKEDGRLTLEEKASTSGDSTGESDVEEQFQSRQEEEIYTPREQTLALDDDEELDFDAPNITMSVRKLMHRIQSMSGPVEDADLTIKSNQDGDDDSNEDDDAQDHDDDDNSCETTFENLEPTMLETTVIPTYVPSCFPEAQMPLHLTVSVRRLVIDLKDDAERGYEMHQQHGFAARRRGNSCPVPIRPPPAPTVFPASTSTTPIALARNPDAQRKRKKSTFGRLAPRLLETLNFRRKKKTFHYTDEELESIEGARWKIVELAFRFGGKHRFYLVQAINMFFPLTKYGRRGGSHPTRLHCNHCGTLQWQHKRGSLSDSVDLAQALQVFDGRQTAVFRKYATSAALEARSFSIIFSDRTLDLETQSMSHRDWLMSALQTLISYSKSQREAEERAIAERRILPLEDLQLSGHSSNDILMGIASPPSSFPKAMPM